MLQGCSLFMQCLVYLTLHWSKFALPTCAAETIVTFIPVLLRYSKKCAPCPAASTHRGRMVAASLSKGQEESFSSIKKMLCSFHKENISDQKEIFCRLDLVHLLPAGWQYLICTVNFQAALREPFWFEQRWRICTASKAKAVTQKS